MTELVAGTRGSALALWQTRHVARLLKERAGVDVRERVITTEGDTSKVERLAGKLEKGFFTKEIEAELLSGAIHIAVHSLKDLPTRLTDGLALGAVLERADAFDVLIVHKEALLAAAEGSGDLLPLRAGARVGTSSLRRDALLKAYAPGVQSLPLRGNVPTRIEKLRAKSYDAVVMAAAGVRRLQIPLDGLEVLELDPRRWPPAPGQGAVAVEVRADDADTLRAVAFLDHAPSRIAVEQERSILRELEGGCTTPFGAYAHGSHAWVGRAGLDGKEAPWRAARVALTPGAGEGSGHIAAALRALDESTRHDPLLTLSGEDLHDSTIPLYRSL